MTKWSVKGISVLAGGVALVFSEIAPAQSLKEAVTQAIETNPSVLSAARRKEAADHAIDAAKGGYFPRVDFLYGGGRERSQNPTTLTSTPGWVRLSRKEEGLILNQMLWDGFGTKSEVDRRRAISESSAHRAYGTAEEIALQAIDAYLDVLRNRDLLGYAKENLDAHRTTYDQVKLRADKGVGRRADLDQIEARLALATSNVASAESTLRDAEIAYQRVVGKAPMKLSLPAAPQNIPRSVDDAVKTGFNNHPVLKSAQSDVDAAQAQREIARSFYSPRLEFEASMSNNRNIDGIDGPNRDRMYMFWVKWNLFRGGFDHYRGKETAVQINEAQEIARNTSRQVEAAVRLAYNAYATARDRLPSLERYVKSANSTRVAYSQQFAIGQRTLLDQLDSENEYLTARSTHTNGRFIELSARYRILNATGQLLTALDVKPPVEAMVEEK